MFGAPVYVYHEIVHNKYVVETFRSKGAIFVDDLNEVPEGSNLLFSAHGVSPEIRAAAKARKLNAIDATCPLVTKVHLEAIKYAKEGYTIFLIGHEGHDEVIGTMGEAPEAMVFGRNRRGRRQVGRRTRCQGGLSDSNYTFGRRCKSNYQTLARAVSQSGKSTQRKTSAMRLRIDKRQCGKSPLMRMCVWCWEVKTAVTANDFAELANDSGVSSYLIDGSFRYRCVLV